jgi:CelD/BcsL family acetyltransferase involved in cellulose biosynthesis
LVIHSVRRLAQSAREHAGVRVEDRLRLEPVRDLSDLEEVEWDQLAQRCGNVFATREWISTWWEVFAGRGSLMFFACRGVDGRLVALLPMYVCPDGQKRELRFLGQQEADRLGPVCAPGDRLAAADAMRRALHESRACFDVFVGDDLPEQDGWGAAIGARRVGRTSSPVLHADGRVWNAFLATRSANFRQQVRRRERRLARGYGLRYRLTEDAARLDADLDVLLHLHEGRWGRASRSFAGSRETFHRAFAAKALERGWLRLWIAELDGRAAAAWYGFRYGGAEWYYQAGRDRRYDELSIGFVLLAHTIRTALDDGVEEYRLLRGDEAYKMRFADGDAPLETVRLASDDVPGPEQVAVAYA